VQQNKTFCILPWIHLYANPDGNVLPCCIGDYRMPLGNVRQETVEELWNNDEFKSMRKNMLAGKECKQCSACYSTEAAGGQSFRQSSNKAYAEFISLTDSTNSDGSLGSIDLKYLDIRWSNICNFKCKGCSGTYSSSWAKEERRNDIFIFSGGKDNDALYEQIRPFLSTVKEIYFAGGEPLLMDKHYEILEYLISTGNTDIKIRYNTNLSKLEYKGLSVIKLWKQFTNVHLGISLDHYGLRGEYIREGTDWKILENNIKLVRQKCPHVHTGIASVVSVFNVSTLPEFVDYLISKKLVDNNTYVSLYPIINPDYYSFDVIPDNIKEKIINNLSNLDYNSQLNNQLSVIIEKLKNSKYNIKLSQEFKEKVIYYDKIRSTNFNKTFPELREWYEKI